MKNNRYYLKPVTCNLKLYKLYKLDKLDKLVTRTLLALMMALLLLLPIGKAWGQTVVFDDFEGYSASKLREAGSLPPGWDCIYTGNTSTHAPKVVGTAGGSGDYCPSNYDFGKRIAIIAGDETSYGDVAYVILPQYGDVHTISFNAWWENKTYGPLELG